MCIHVLLIFACFVAIRGRVIEIPIYGDVFNHGYYYIKLSVGRPIKQLQTLIIDTGSSFTGFTCKECLNCGEHEFKPFDIDLSESSHVMKCKNSTYINNKNDIINSYNGVANIRDLKHHFSYIENKCVYDIRYSEGSHIFGYFFEDFVEFEIEPSYLESEPEMINKFVLGCNLIEDNLIKYQNASGILGLANFNKSGMNRIIDFLLQNNELKESYNEKFISIFFGKIGGKLTFSSTNLEHANIEDSYSDVYNITRCVNDERYCAYINKIEIDSDHINADIKLKENSFKAIFDTGTTISIFPTKLFYEITRKLFKVVSRSYPAISGYDVKDGLTCWKFENGASIENFPNIKVTFVNHYDQYTESIKINWSPESYLYLHKTLGMDAVVYCLGIASSNFLRLDKADLSHVEQNFNMVDEIIFGSTFFIDKKITFFLNEHKIMIRDLHSHTSSIKYFVPGIIRSFDNTSNSVFIVKEREINEENAIKVREYKFKYALPGVVFMNDIYLRNKCFAVLVIFSPAILVIFYLIIWTCNILSKTSKINQGYKKITSSNESDASTLETQYSTLELFHIR
ncbi:membrane associated aspartyl protease [Cryptosporidium canis]|uniref:Membrane associated aspartyl protease n=1 Tax=Cryptosporidium canis TaxID=195482 RepID=A0ABQ8P6N6_9CRYT|nr:membrane associated aspartyl protease [Cryptosporidium canis]